MLWSYILPVKLVLMFLVLSSSMLARDEHDYVDTFDKPVTTVLDLGPSPYYRPSSQMRKTLTCYIYPSFMVKQYDERQKGAEWLSILRFKPSNPPACSLTHLGGEKVIHWPEWSGYFRGAKGPFAFFDASDGIDVGMPFVVYDTRTGKKVFEDSDYLWSATSVPASSKVFKVSLDDKQRLVLTYLRVVSTNCDLMKDGAVCWKRVTSKYGILATQQPVCHGYKQDYKGKWWSAVGYPVSVVVSAQNRIKAVDGPVFCWPTD
jgi:hypothetical protein